MFCPTCQQDVPALAVPEEPGVVRCAFCGEELGARSRESEVRGHESDSAERVVDLDELPDFKAYEPEPVTSLPGAAQVTAANGSVDLANRQVEAVKSLPRRPDMEDWELEPQLRAAERLLKGLQQESQAGSPMAAYAAHAQSSGWHAAAADQPKSDFVQRTRQEPAAPTKVEKSGTLAWTCLSLGVMALACGGVLIAWSLGAQRPDLWSIGLPLAVVGQGGLVIGLLLQLDGLWQSSKKTEETLTQLDGKLHDLAHTTTMLGTTRSTPAQSFYVHMAEGASPHLLLADLKGQLDLLAERLARK